MVVAGRRADKGEEVVGHIRAEGGQAIFVRTDVTQEAEVEALVARTVHEYGRLDGAALDYATEGIRVNAVLPGPIETEIWSHMEHGDPIFHSFVDGVPMQRAAHSGEVARPVLFLLSDWSTYITGTSLVIDGGYSAR